MNLEPNSRLKSKFMEMYYIEYLNKSKNFERDIKEFQGANALKNAISWGKKNLYNFNMDMIKHK